jgi:integrative and conjugative element protein (TIGR02256 family)
VFLVRPGRDACKACLASFARAPIDGDDAPTGWIGVPEGDDDVLLHECGRPVIPASAVDLTFVAALAARIGLSVLEEATTEANHWLWSQSALPEIDIRLSLPMSTVTEALEPQADCPVCRAPEVAALVLPAEVRREIQDQVEASLTAETGGILIGYVDDRRRAVVMRATGPGPGAERSASVFRRDVGFVQGELARAGAELGERGVYVGEWHSHLETDPSPSPTDILSLSGIASSADYLNRSPALLIAGLDPSNGRCASLNAWIFRAGGGMWPVTIDDEPDDLHSPD